MSLKTQMEGLLEVREESLDGFVDNVSSVESGLPVWSIWFTTIVLSLTFAVGIPLNGVTVLIFLRRKKLRHLVNFVLLLDCLSHIILCGVCIPVHLASVWSQPTDLLEFSRAYASSKWVGLLTLQQVVGNFANLYGILLSLSIAVLRYRRLCWKKKDKFSRLNAVKWSVSNGILALAITFTDSWTSLHPNTPDFQRITLTLYAMKVTLIMSSMVLVFFCYVRVSQRVWANAASQEKVMDPMKLKKSRSVHLRATIHSCVQIILVVAMGAPYIYEETIKILELLAKSTSTVVTVAAAEYYSPSPTHLPVTLLSTTESMSIATPIELNQHRGLGLDINHLTRLIAVTLNYTLLALGTPLAYIASCHRFREQFTSILCGRMGSFYFVPVGTPHRHGDQQNGGLGHLNNNNTNNFTSNQRKLKSPSSPTAEIFDTVSLPRTRSQRSRSRSQPMALSPSTMISSVMSTPGKSHFDGRRASCQSVRVQMYKANRTNHFFSYCTPQMHEYSAKLKTVNNGVGNAGANHFVNNCNYSSYGSSSSTSEIVGHNV